MNTICGMDGCKGGWFAVSKDLGTQKITWQIIPSIEEIKRFSPIPEVIAMDIPIGLVKYGARECDQKTRQLLGAGRGSSVFPAPIRPVLYAKSYLEASRIRYGVEGKKMSRQAWGIIAKVREVDEFIRENPEWADRIREIHPEVSFYFLVNQKPMSYRKKILTGKLERLKLLEPYFGDAIEETLRKSGHSACADDDVLDAFAALWTAERIISRSSISIPDPPPIDDCGIRMCISA